jgi:hypothetical protein
VLITFSAGVAERAFGENQEELIARADRALYHAKRAGKNSVSASEQNPRTFAVGAYGDGTRRAPLRSANPQSLRAARRIPSSLQTHNSPQRDPSALRHAKRRASSPDYSSSPCSIA